MGDQGQESGRSWRLGSYFPIFFRRLSPVWVLHQRPLLWFLFRTTWCITASFLLPGGQVTTDEKEFNVLVTDGIHRTYKFLAAIARKVPIVPITWLTESRMQGAFSGLFNLSDHASFCNLSKLSSSDIFQVLSPLWVNMVIWEKFLHLHLFRGALDRMHVWVRKFLNIAFLWNHH